MTQHLRVGNIPLTRLSEITSWLQKRLSPEEALAIIESDEANVIKPSNFERILEIRTLLVTGIWIILLFHRITDGSRRKTSEGFRLWLSNHDLAFNELWEYDTGGNSWENLCGECGFAIVSDGVVVDFWMYLMN